VPAPLTASIFWSRKVVTESGCWEWNGGRHRDGYGALTFNREYWLAHRLAWRLTHGEIPADVLVCHRCDNPPCINPAHLFIGTHADNMADMKAKRRRRDRGTGEANGRAVLSAADVEAIRALYGRNGRGGLTQLRLAERFGVRQTMISNVVRGLNWR
jgi:hypothetical protein